MEQLERTEKLDKDKPFFLRFSRKGNIDSSVRPLQAFQPSLIFSGKAVAKPRVDQQPTWLATLTTKGCLCPAWLFV